MKSEIGKNYERRAEIIREFLNLVEHPSDLDRIFELYKFTDEEKSGMLNLIESDDLENLLVATEILKAKINDSKNTTTDRG